MSIRVRFLFLIGVLSLCATCILAFISYRYSINNAFAEAKDKGSIIFDYIDASRLFFREQQRPLIMELVEEERFYPELMSGFVLTRGVWEKFHKNNPDYLFKQATVDPLYPPNKADSDELAIIASFRDNPGLKTDEGILEKSGEKYFYFARPIKVKSKCLRCHGDPSTAPKDQIEIYGTSNGYNWSKGDTVASFVVYVPVNKAIEKAKKSSITLIIYGVGGVAILMLILWFFFDRVVIRPLTHLEQAATDISLGKNLKSSIKTDKDDEIGSLTKAVDRLRISVDKILDRQNVRK